MGMSTPQCKSPPGAASPADQSISPTTDSARADSARAGSAAPAKELGGPPGPEPTRFGDWEKNGRCIDF